MCSLGNSTGPSTVSGLPGPFSLTVRLLPCSVAVPSTGVAGWLLVSVVVLNRNSRPCPPSKVVLRMSDRRAPVSPEDSSVTCRVSIV
jgi:hypothetical protein